MPRTVRALIWHTQHFQKAVAMPAWYLEKFCMCHHAHAPLPDTRSTYVGTVILSKFSAALLRYRNEPNNEHIHSFSCGNSYRIISIDDLSQDLHVFI